MTDADRHQFTMLTMLHSMCQQALPAFYAADNPVDAKLVVDLERMVKRARVEIDGILVPHSS